MSTVGTRGAVRYDEALGYATTALELLRPHCERIEIAGSLRRKCARINDIEIVAIPKPYEPEGLFQTGIATVVNQWPVVKGHLPCKYTQRILPWCGMKLDLFFPTVDNWGYQLAIRTGPADFSHKVLARGWVKAGYESREGVLYGRSFAARSIVHIREEAELFHLIGLKFIQPEDRR